MTKYFENKTMPNPKVKIVQTKLNVPSRGAMPLLLQCHIILKVKRRRIFVGIEFKERRRKKLCAAAKYWTLKKS